MEKSLSHGKVVGIYISRARGEPTQSVEPPHKTGRELTLIESEAIDAISQQENIPITPAQARRNIVTYGISLNNLVGRFFYVGKIQLHGVRLCEPCSYLANRTDPRILQAMKHRGGLRAEIISDGIIHLDDKITIQE
jgi:MOSC domain-containing protein YiiM